MFSQMIRTETAKQTLADDDIVAVHALYSPQKSTAKLAPSQPHMVSAVDTDLLWLSIARFMDRGLNTLRSFIWG